MNSIKNLAAIFMAIVILATLTSIGSVAAEADTTSDIRRSETWIKTELTSPQNGQTVSGDVLVKAIANSYARIVNMSLIIKIGNTAGKINMIGCIESAPTGNDIYTRACSYKWDTSSYKGQKVILTVLAENADNTIASDSSTVYVMSDVQEDSIIRVKAYDVTTGQLIPDATTIVLKYDTRPIGKITQTGSGVTVSGSTVAGDFISETETEQKIQSSESTSGLVLKKGIVIGTLKANGIDYMKVEPGVYGLLTYASGYTLYEYRLYARSGQEYNLHAPISTGYLPEQPSPEIGEIGTSPNLITVKEVTSGGREVIKIMPELVDEQIESIHAGEIELGKVKVSIKSVEKGVSGKFLIESENVEATTNADIEVEEKKLYIKTNDSKDQVKVLPGHVSETIRQSLRIDVKNMELKMIEGNAVYEVEAEEDSNLLGFIPVKMTVKTGVDAETGEVTSIVKPWWSFATVSIAAAK